MSCKFSDKCKKGFPRNFGRSYKILKPQPQKFIWWTRSFLLLTPLTSGLLCVKFYGEGGRLNHFKHLRTTRAMLMNFCFFNTPRFQILISGCKVLQSQITSPPPNPHVTPSDLIRVKMFIFKQWVFLRNVWNFNKWKSLIINEKCWMLRKSNAKENINFAIKIISTENAAGESYIFNKKITEELRRKSQTYFSSKLLPWATRLRVTFSGTLSYF